MTLNTRGKIVSIVINNEFFKICEVTKGVKNATIHKVATVATPADCYYDGAILDMNGLSKAIRVALDDNRITTTNVVFSITSTKIATKEVVIPNVKTNKIKGIIQANANEYFPVNIDEYIVQYIVQDKIEEDGVPKLKVLVMAAPSKMIDEYYLLASKLSLKVNAIDYIGNSTAQVLRHQIGNETSVFIQVENDSTIVNIFENNVLQLQRTIPYGKSVVVNEVMSEENLHYQAAYEKLQQEEILHKEFDGDPLTENLRYMVSNINRVMDYYISRGANKGLEKAYIIGGATTMKNFVELMTAELHVQLINMTEFKDVTIDRKGYIDEREVMTYTSNIGALIDPVNFVPKLMVEEEKKKGTGKFYAMVMVGSIVIAFAMVAVPMIGMLTSMSTRDSLQRDVDNMKDIEGVVNEYYKAKDMADDATAFKALTVNPDDSLYEFITMLETKMPADVTITSMNVASGAVSLTGTATSKSSVAKFIQQLQAEPNVSAVYVASETEAKDNTDSIIATFSLTCVFSNISTN